MKIHEFMASHSRGSGKTTALAKIVKELNGTMFVRSELEAKRVQELYGVNAISIQVPDEYLRGRLLGPSFIDPDACYFLVEKYTRPLEEEINVLQKRLYEAESYLFEVRDKLGSYEVVHRF